MAGSHARIQNGIWRDEDFRALSIHAQQLYVLLLSQQDRGHAGTLTLAIPRWASMSADATEESVERALIELHEHRFVVVDWFTVEVLVRSTIRHDSVWKQPKLKSFVVTEISGVYSEAIKAALRAELARIPGAWAAEVLAAVDVSPPDAEGDTDPLTYPPSKGGYGPPSRVRTPFCG